MGIKRHNPQDSQIQQLDYQRQIDQNRRFLQQETQIQGLRLTIDYTRLDNITSIINKNGISESLLIAQNFVKNVFKVYPEIYTVVVKDSAWTNGYESICTTMLNKENIEIDQKDVDPGIGQSDLHVYALWEDNDQDDYLARADACQWVNDRPLVGFIKFNINWFNRWYTASSNDFTYIQNNILHQIFHILGFGINNIPYFRNEQGMKMTQEQLDSILSKKQIRNKETYLLKSKNVLRIAKEHFDCDELEGMQLENDEQISMHWEQTIMFNDIMSPEVVQTKSVISDITLAYFLDTNWYADIDLTSADQSLWGKNKGCLFLDNCDTQFEEFSSNTITETQCTLDMYSKSQVTQTDYSDGCYVQTQIEKGNCFDILQKSDEIDFTYEDYGKYSKCFQSTFTSPGQTSSNQSRCYQHYCDTDNQQLVVEIEVEGSKKQIRCNYNESGVEKSPPDATLIGKFICPQNIEKICNLEYPVPCETHCYSRGYCLFRENRAVCQCNSDYAGLKCNEQCVALLTKDDNLCLEGDICQGQKEFFDGTKKCQDCHTSCTYCDGPTENDCRQCEQGKFNQNGSCVIECSSGKFANKLNGECEQCDSSCSTGCAGSKFNCKVQPFVDSGMSIIDQSKGKYLVFNIMLCLIFIIIYT